MSSFRLGICAGLVCALSGCFGPDGDGATARRDSSVGEPDHLDASRADASRFDPDGFDAMKPTFDLDAGPSQCMDVAGLNLDCPERVVPLDGCFAQKGVCCFRRSNTVRREEAVAAGETSFRLAYRLQFEQPQNHPVTLGLEAIVATSQVRLEQEAQSLLWAFEAKIDDAGTDVNGEGFQFVGPGAYLCDGTYSFYGDSAAPAAEANSGDPARWAVTKLPATVLGREAGVDRFAVTWQARTDARQFAYTPYLASDFTLDWELVTMDVQILDFGVTDDENCIGGRGPGGSWNAQGDYIDYVPLLANDHEDISAIAQSYCKLLAFGILAHVGTEPECGDPRCTPGTANCPWVKLPDSLCPLDPVTGEVDAAEAAKWGCHVGFDGNPDGAPTHCTADAPTGVLDLDVPGTSEGQCCDPLGLSITLPACNAWIVHHAFVAAAAEVAAVTTNELQSNCTLGAQ